MSQKNIHASSNWGVTNYFSLEQNLRIIFSINWLNYFLDEMLKKKCKCPTVAQNPVWRPQVVSSDQQLKKIIQSYKTAKSGKSSHIHS